MSATLRSPGRPSVAARIGRETTLMLRLLQPADAPAVWVLGQKKTGTSLAANFISQGIYGRPAAVDLPVRRWLQRWTLPWLFKHEPGLAVGLISRVLREPVVKEPNLCYHVRELAAALDSHSTIVYVTRERARHVRSFLDRILERSGHLVRIRSDLNFVWRAYLGGLRPGAVVNDQDLAAMIRRLSQHFDAVDRHCLEVIGTARSASLSVRYEDISAGGDRATLHDTLSRRWSTFDWQRACRTLEVQHQPRGQRVIDEQLIAKLVARRARRS